MARRTPHDSNRTPGGDDDDPRDRFDESEDLYGQGDDGDDDEGSDDADRERFASEIAYCPECGAEVFDAADICPKCFSWIDGDTTHRKPSRLRASINLIVVAVLLAVMLAGVGFYALVRLAP